MRLCPWSLALASSIPVLGLKSVCPRKGCSWPWPRIVFVSLASVSSLVSSTPPLHGTLIIVIYAGAIDVGVSSCLGNLEFLPKSRLEHFSSPVITLVTRHVLASLHQCVSWSSCVLQQKIQFTFWLRRVKGN